MLSQWLDQQYCSRDAISQKNYKVNVKGQQPAACKPTGWYSNHWQWLRYNFGFGASWTIRGWATRPKTAPLKKGSSKTGFRNPGLWITCRMCQILIMLKHHDLDIDLLHTMSPCLQALSWVTEVVFVEQLLYKVQQGCRKWFPEHRLLILFPFPDASA